MLRDVAGAPEEVWRDVLLAKLHAERPRIVERMAYYAGDHTLPRAPKAAQDAYRRLMRQSRQVRDSR
jgi:hypothetical protein